MKRLKEKPNAVHKLKPLFSYFHKYEAKFGELAQIKDLERQMGELFPEDPKLSHFAARFASEKFNPITARVIISPAQQMRPKMLQVIQSVERPSTATSAVNSPRPVFRAELSPRPALLQPSGTTNSPKRPLVADDSVDYDRPRKVARGESPLKGAAGRRMRMQKDGTQTSSKPAAPIPRDITFLLSQIPPAESYNAQRFLSDSLVRVIRDTHVPDYSEWKDRQNASLAGARPGTGGVGGLGHSRTASLDYAPSPYGGTRDSPGPTGRPLSPYGAPQRVLQTASVTYRNSPLRPGSSGSYEPPPIAFQHQQGMPPVGYPMPPPGQYQQVPPPGQYITQQPDGGSYGGFAPPAGYAPPPGVAYPPASYGQPPPQQYGAPPPQYGGYRY